MFKKSSKPEFVIPEGIDEKGFDPSFGGKVPQRSTRLCNTLERISSTGDYTSPVRGIYLTWRAVNNTSMSFTERIRTLLNLGRAYVFQSIPGDREVYRAPDEAHAQNLIGFVDEFITPESEVRGMEHLEEVTRRSREKMNVVLMHVPHRSPIEPLLFQAHMQRQIESGSLDEGQISAAQFAKEQLVVAVSHKITQHRLSLLFTKTLHTLRTIQTKYHSIIKKQYEEARRTRNEDDPQVVKAKRDLDMANAYLRNAAQLLVKIRKHPDYLLFIFPEGGFTPDNNQVNISTNVAGIAKRSIILPVHQTVPDNLLRLRKDGEICLTPSRIDLTFGEPFYHDGSSSNKSENVGELIRQLYKSLIKVEVDLAELTFGLDDEEKGFPQIDPTTGNLIDQ